MRSSHPSAWIDRLRRRRKPLLGGAAAVLAISLAGGVVGSGASAATHAAAPKTSGGVVTYTAKVTIPAPPSSNFSGASAGGDGWGVALTPTAVYNVFHHSLFLGVNCHEQSNASQCWPSVPYKTISEKLQGTPASCPGSDANGCFLTSGQPGMYMDQATGHLFVYATLITSNAGAFSGTAGVVCIDTTQPASNLDPICAKNGFTPLSAAGDADISTYEWSAISDPVVVGSKFYAFNYDFAAGSGATRNKLMCFSLTTFSACAGQPYAVSLGAGSPSDTSYPAPAIAAIGSDVMVPIGKSTAAGTTYEVACWDTAVAGGSCGKAWPVVDSVSYPSSEGAPFPALTAGGAVAGVCLPISPDPCYTLAGGTLATPSHLATTVFRTQGWNGPSLTIGPRVYVPNRNQQAQATYSGEIECFDYSKNASCPNFPKTFQNMGGGLYTVNPDPQRPTCFWVNADGGADQIQNFDAFTGGQCGRGPVHVLASSFVVPITECVPTSWTSLQVTSPYPPSVYGGGSVAFEDADGNPLPGVPTTPVSSTGFIDLSHFDLSTRNGLPQFVLTLNKPPSNLKQVVLVLKWKADYSTSCLQPGTTASPPETEGYRLEGGDGGVFDYNRPYRGSVGFPSPPGLGLHIFNFTGMALAPDGYWLVQRNGGIFSFHAPYHGSLPGNGVTVDDIVGIASTPDGGGYWEAGADGTVYPFGDAPTVGSLSGVDDVVAILSPDAHGYLLVGANGAVYALGDAHYHGSCLAAGSGCQGVHDVVGIASPDAGGYWLVAADGGVFGFGDARYHGSCPLAGSGCQGVGEIVGLASPDAGGYWLARSDGSVYTFGDARFMGSCLQPGSACVHLVRPIIAITS